MLIIEGKDSDLQRAERLIAILAKCDQTGLEAIDSTLTHWEALARSKKRKTR